MIFLWSTSPGMPSISLRADKRKSQDGVKMPSCHVPTANDTTVDILVVIISAPHHFNKRKYLRRTWAGQSDIFPAIRFWVGKSNEESVNKDLEEEEGRFKDVCRLDLTDTYAALPVKVFSILQWSLSVPFKFLMKVDDDVLINPEGIDRLKREVLNQFSKKRVIFGFPMKNTSVHRHGKYAVKEHDFKRSKYPDFVLGHFYILTAKAVRNIVNEGLNKVEIPLEDAAITGVLRDLSGTEIVSIKQHIIPSLDYVVGLIEFFGDELNASAKHVAEYSVVHCQFHNVKNASKGKEETIGNWIWTNAWKHLKELEQ